MHRVLEETQSPLSSVTDFVLHFADVSHPDTIRSSHALDLLAAIYGEDKARKQDAAKVCLFFPPILNSQKEETPFIQTVSARTVFFAGHGHVVNCMAHTRLTEKFQHVGKITHEQALDLLAEKYDPIRANYWNYRKALLDQVTASA